MLSAPEPLVIRRIDLWRCRIPTRRPHVMSFGTCQHIDFAIVQVVAAGGLAGWGEVPALGGPSWSEESAESVFAHLRGYLAPLTLGHDARRLTWLRTRWDSGVRGNPFAKAALEMALLDLNARCLGVPLADLLGGVVRDRVEFSWSLAAPTVDEDLREAAGWMERGHRIFKIKVGGRPLEDDLERVAALRDALGAEADLRVDANQGWSRVEAFQAVARLAQAAPTLLEQPLPRNDLDGLQRLQAVSPIPLMADESVTTVRTAVEVASRDAARIFALKPAKHGGLLPALHVAAVARAMGIGLYLGCMIETGIGTAACAHLAAALPALEFGCELFGPLLLAGDVVAGGVTYEPGRVVVPRGPGLGVEVDLVRVEGCAEDHWSDEAG